MVFHHIASLLWPNLEFPRPEVSQSGSSPVAYQQGEGGRDDPDCHQTREDSHHNQPVEKEAGKAPEDERHAQDQGEITEEARQQGRVPEEQAQGEKDGETEKVEMLIRLDNDQAGGQAGEIVALTTIDGGQVPAALNEANQQDAAAGKQGQPASYPGESLAEPDQAEEEQHDQQRAGSLSPGAQ